MTRVETALQKVNQIVALLGGFIIAIMMIHISADIIARFFLNKPLPGTITIVAHYYMIAAIFLPLAYTEQIKASIIVDLLSKFFSERVNKCLELFSYLLIAVTALTIAYVSWDVALKNFALKTSVMQGDYTIPTWPSYFIFCGGCVLLGIYCLAQLFVSYKKVKGQGE